MVQRNGPFVSGEEAQKRGLRVPKFSGWIAPNALFSRVKSIVDFFNRRQNRCKRFAFSDANRRLPVVESFPLHDEKPPGTGSRW